MKECFCDKGMVFVHRVLKQIVYLFINPETWENNIAN